MKAKSHAQRAPVTSAYTLFCDDLRVEAGGKVSAMGIYQGVLGIPQEQHDLAKFVAITFIRFPGQTTAVSAKISLCDRDQTLAESEVPIPAVPSDLEDSHLAILTIPIEASPFRAADGMRLYVRFSMGDFNYRSDILEVQNETVRGSMPYAKSEPMPMKA